MLQQCNICFREEIFFVYNYVVKRKSGHTLQQQPGLAESHHVMFFHNEILLQFKVQEQGFLTLLGRMGFSRAVCLFSCKDQSIVAGLLHGLLIWVYYLFSQH